MTGLFEHLVTGDIAVSSGVPVIVCDQPHLTASGLAVTAQQIDAQRMPIGHAYSWIGGPHDPVILLRHGGQWLTPPGIPALPGDEESAYAYSPAIPVTPDEQPGERPYVLWRDPNNPAEHALDAYDDAEYRREQEDL